MVWNYLLNTNDKTKIGGLRILEVYQYFSWNNADLRNEWKKQYFNEMR